VMVRFQPTPLPAPVFVTVSATVYVGVWSAPVRVTEKLGAVPIPSVNAASALPVRVSALVLQNRTAASRRVRVKQARAYGPVATAKVTVLA
jgi:hypothetical protein